MDYMDRLSGSYHLHVYRSLRLFASGMSSSLLDSSLSVYCDSRASFLTRLARRWSLSAAAYARSVARMKSE